MIDLGEPVAVPVGGNLLGLVTNSRCRDGWQVALALDEAKAGVAERGRDGEGLERAASLVEGLEIVERGPAAGLQQLEGTCGVANAEVVTEPMPFRMARDRKRLARPPSPAGSESQEANPAAVGGCLEDRGALARFLDHGGAVSADLAEVEGVHQEASGAFRVSDVIVEGFDARDSE